MSGHENRGGRATVGNGIDFASLGVKEFSWARKFKVRSDHYE